MVAQAALTRFVMVRIHEEQPLFINMIMIRRAVDKNRAYTVIFLKGEPPKWIPTSDYEHQRILEIYKQDKRYEGILNDFTDLDLH